MDKAKLTSLQSKDPDKKVGAVLVKNNKILSSSYNSFPKGVTIVGRLSHKPTKLAFTVHAETNAIYKAANAGIKLNGSTIFCTFFPCSDCAKAIIQSGVVEVVAPVLDKNSSWYEEMLSSQILLEEAKIKITHIEYE